MLERAVKELVCVSSEQAWDSDTELSEMLDKFRGRSKHHLCIYAKTLTTADGAFTNITQT